jgi:predicted neuraminidase
MSKDEVRAFEIEVAEKIADLALVPPQLNTNPLPKYDYDQLDYGMTIGIARTPGGRIYACWVAGEDGPKAFFVLNRSDNDGETWSKPCLVIDAHDPARLPAPRSTLVGNLWTDPNGKLHLFFSQSMTQFDGRAGSWEAVCENPDAEKPAWGAPRRIWHGFTLNKPTVLSTGEWLLPISLNCSGGFVPFRGAFKNLDPVRGANVFRSTDQGATWERLSGVAYPKPCWDEHMFVERKDGSVWMLARTGTGIMQSVSTDRGKTWSEPTTPESIRQPVTRFHIRKLASGRLLLVKHGDTADTTEGKRNKLKAFLSEDDGKTWIGGLMLDERNGVSYPDGFQAPDGTLYVSYDRNRASAGEILLARFTEADILAGKLTGPKSKLRMLISRPLKNEFKAFESNDEAQPLVTGPSAELEKTNGEIRTLEKGARIYPDRDYTFHDIPAALAGRRFVFSGIGRTEAVCAKEGVVYVFTPTSTRNPHDSAGADLFRQGFVKAAVPEFVYALVDGQARQQETCSVFQKLLKPGETVRFGRWGVLVF